METQDYHKLETENFALRYVPSEHAPRTQCAAQAVIIRKLSQQLRSLKAGENGKKNRVKIHLESFCTHWKLADYEVNSALAKLQKKVPPAIRYPSPPYFIEGGDSRDALN